MTKFFNAIWTDEDGATAIEYGLLAALISVAIILAVTTLRGTLSDVFESVNSDLEPAVAQAPAAQ